MRGFVMAKGDRDKLRAELAGKAMQGILANEESMMYLGGKLAGDECMNSAVAFMAKGYADALMKELGLDGE